MSADNRIVEAINSISKKLEIIEEHMAWLIKAGQRFKVGQRVEWSRRGRKAGFPTRKKATKGTVKEVTAFSIVVKLDGLKREGQYQHAFFNPVSGPKLF